MFSIRGKGGLSDRLLSFLAIRMLDEGHAASTHGVVEPDFAGGNASPRDDTFTSGDPLAIRRPGRVVYVVTSFARHLADRTRLSVQNPKVIVAVAIRDEGD